ncbi:hypothetical protein HON71_00660 [Candidatus Woesearchaeota archaeon]|nr:hypothetical protein [Candidatus Woesearchaeota archaeon]
MIKNIIYDKKKHINKKLKIRVMVLKKLYYINESLKTLFCTKKGKIGDYHSTKNVLFFIHSNHIDFKNKEIFRINNIINKIKKDNYIKPFILVASQSSEKVYSAIQRLLRCNNTIYDFISLKDKKEAKIKSKELASLWISISEREKIKILRSNEIFECVSGPLDLYFSKEFLYYLILYYKASKRAIIKSKSKAIIITATNGLFERCLMAAASSLNIPTIILQHGAGGSDIKYKLRDPYKFITFSKFYKNKLIKNMIQKKNVIITGPYIFDDLYKYTLSKIKIRKRQQKNIAILTVPFVEQGYYSKKEYFGYIKIIIKEIKKSGSHKIFIKLHPREKHIKEYKKLIKKNDFKEVLIGQKTNQGGLYDIINKSDMVINFSSTTAIETMILNKPLITMLMPNFDNPLNKWLHESKATIEISINGDLSKTIKKILIKDTLIKNRKKLVHKLCGKIDGRSSERIVQLIYSLYKK